MDQSFIETINTLHQARIYLRLEIGGLVASDPIDGQALRRLHEMARSFQEQAHSLLVKMLYQDVPEALQQEAEDLVEAFHEAVLQLEDMTTRLRPLVN